MRWRRWILIAAAAASLYAAAGFLVVPWVARRQLVALARADLHRTLALDRVRFNPFTWRGVVEGVRLADRDGEPLFALERLVVDLQVSGLFRRAWRFREIALEAPALHARLLPDGRLTVADLFEGEPAPEAEPFTWPRLIVDRFQLRRGRATFVDGSRAPAFVQEITPLELEVHDLITIPRESGDHTLVLGLGKEAALRWSGTQTVDPLRLQGRVDLQGIPLDRLWEYLAPGDPMTVRAGRGDVLLQYDVQRSGSGGLILTVREGTVRLRGVVAGARAGEEAWLSLPEGEASGIEAAWPQGRVTVPHVRLASPQVLMRFEPAGWNWARPAANPAPETAPSTSWSAAVADVEVSGGTLVLDDRIVSPPVTTTLSALSLRLRGLSTDWTAPVKGELTASVNAAGKGSVTGTFVPVPWSSDFRVALSGIDMTPFEPYSVRLPGAELKKLTAALEGRLQMGPGSPAFQFEGDGTLDGLQVAGAGEDRLLGCQQARLRRVRLTVAPDRLRMERVEVDGAEFKLHIDKQGNFNLAQLSAQERAAAPEREPFPVDITRIVFARGGGSFTDESLILPFGTRIHAMHGDLKDFSTRSTAPARLDLEGRVLEEGYFKSSGTLRLADPLAATDVNVLFREVRLPSLTPYSAQFAGYSLQQGMLDLDVRYRLADRKLLGDHHVVAKDLVLGPKVEGAEGPGLPVRLAVALLKDRQGRIDLEVPVEGTVDSPEFNYRSVFWQALKTILGNVAKAPFRAIGRAFGTDEEDLELVGFAAGRSELPEPEADKLAKVAAELAGRDGIALAIEGRFDPVTDAAALRRDRLESRIDALRTPDSNLDQILEALYAETFSAEKLSAARLQFSVDAGTGASFYEALQAELLEAEPVGPEDLSSLAVARGQSIAAALTTGGLDPGRVRVTDPSPVKRKKQGSDLVPSEMTLAAED
ncbi:MAG TPA: DUF748 domain-containing protein [Candidatus Polarisedimenticolaceae bacterium]|nr:DUF748 domain-containing protein [Candidatus Polarisedimenticolaceae bacterium]